MLLFRGILLATVATTSTNDIVPIIIIRGIHTRKIVHQKYNEDNGTRCTMRWASVPKREYYHQISETQTKEDANDDRKKGAKARTQVKKWKELKTCRITDLHTKPMSFIKTSYSTLFILHTIEASKRNERASVRTNVRQIFAKERSDC